MALKLEIGGDAVECCRGGAVAGWSSQRFWLRNVAGLHHGLSSVFAA